MKIFIIYWAYFLKYYFTITFSQLTSKNQTEKFVNDAKKFALMTHHRCGQKYDKKYPYYYHLDMVSKFTLKFNSILTGKEQMIVFIIALFHDLIEDCRLTYNDVKEKWGKEIADGVFACTELRGKNRKERHGPEYIKGLQESRLGCFTKICDIIANMTMGKRTGSRMFPMYQKEYSHTKKNLYTVEFKSLFEYIEQNLLA